MYTRIRPTDFDSLTRNSDSSTPERAADSAETASPWKQSLDKLEHFVTSNPGIGLAAAAGFGLLLGWWMKRR